MPKIALPDGQWFDNEQATRFDEDTWWDGSNMRSVVTGSQFDHQALYYTRHGHFVLHRWSQWQGVADTYNVIDISEATRWLITNDCHDALTPLPEDIQQAVCEGMAQAEV